MSTAQIVSHVEHNDVHLSYSALTSDHLQSMQRRIRHEDIPLKSEEIDHTASELSPMNNNLYCL